MHAQKLLPLTLSAKLLTWRMDDKDSDASDTEFKLVRPKVLDRDKHTCRYCGFRSTKGGFYMQVHHKDDDHTNNAMSNLVTIDMHCHAVEHIGLWGSKDEAVLIYLPEMTQALVNHICRLQLVANRFLAKVELEVRLHQEKSKGMVPGQMMDRQKAAKTMNDATQALFDRMRARSVEAEKYLGTSNPADLANAMRMLPGDAFERRDETLAPFRLLLLGRHKPSARDGVATDIMPDIVDAWMGPGGPFGSLEPVMWPRLLSKVMS